MKNIPQHIVIVPDGNRRWAVTAGLAEEKGHQKGAETLEKIIERGHDLDIKNLTVWGVPIPLYQTT